MRRRRRLTLTAAVLIALSVAAAGALAIGLNSKSATRHARQRVNVPARRQHLLPGPLPQLLQGVRCGHRPLRRRPGMHGHADMLHAKNARTCRPITTTAGHAAMPVSRMSNASREPAFPRATRRPARRATRAARRRSSAHPVARSLTPIRRTVAPAETSARRTRLAWVGIARSAILHARPA
jgi:hypothetical protein